MHSLLQESISCCDSLCNFLPSSNYRISNSARVKGSQLPKMKKKVDSSYAPAMKFIE